MSIKGSKCIIDWELAVLTLFIYCNIPIVAINASRTLRISFECPVQAQSINLDHAQLFRHQLHRDGRAIPSPNSPE